MIQEIYEDILVYTPGKLETPHVRGPKLTKPSKVNRSVTPSTPSDISGPPLSPKRNNLFNSLFNHYEYISDIP